MKKPLLLIDAHQDLAWNVQTFGRDYSRSVEETRRLELGTDTPTRNGDTLLGYPEFQQGQVPLVFSTLFAAPIRAKLGDWDGQHYATTEEAHRLYSAQLDVYHRMAEEHPEKFRLVTDQDSLAGILSPWIIGEDGEHPVGLVILMENAEGVREPEELEMWWERGVRIIGPAWAGTRFCGGTREPGPLTSEGYALLEAMAAYGFSLDISHMDEQSVLQALDHYPGTIIASHSNAEALLKGTESNRFLSDRVIQGLVERDGVIGMVPYNRFLKVGWTEADGREQVTLDDVADQIDHVCQVAGDAKHVGIGSDFDGGFGLQRTPAGIDTIADLHKIAPLLSERGYSDDDIAAVFAENWLTILRRTLPVN